MLDPRWASKYEGRRIGDISEAPQNCMAMAMACTWMKFKQRAFIQWYSKFKCGFIVCRGLESFSTWCG